jgi:adenine-specific DNA-methyltransferase
MKEIPMESARDRARALRRRMTNAERSLWQLLRVRQIDGHKFRRQVPLGRHIADFVCHEMRLVIEVDGGQHVASAPSEVERTRFLEAEGYRVLRFWNNEVLANPEGVRTTIAEELQRGHPRPGPPPSRGREGIGELLR